MLLKLRRAGIRKQAGKVEFSRSLQDALLRAGKILQPVPAPEPNPTGNN
jgi:hypothetical protein